MDRAPAANARNRSVGRSLPEDLSSRILDAATVFAERGVERARIEDLVETTGIPTSTIYYYFSGKSDVVTHIVTTLLEKLGDVARDAASIEGSPAVRLDAVISAQLDVVNENPAAFRMFLDELGMAQRIEAIGDAAENVFLAPMERLLQEGCEDGSLSVVDPRVAALAIFGAMAIPAYSGLVNPGGIDTAGIRRQILQMIEHGLVT